MSFAGEYRQARKDALRFELIAYGVCGLFCCFVAGVVGAGVAIVNMQHGPATDQVAVRAPATVRPARVRATAAPATATASEAARGACEAAMHAEAAKLRPQGGGAAMSGQEMADLVCGLSEMQAGPTRLMATR